MQPLRDGWPRWPALVLAVALGALLVVDIATRIAYAPAAGGQCHAATATTTTTATSPPPTVASAAADYRCQLPTDYTGLVYAPTWVLLGDDFAAGVGATDAEQTSWWARLRALARVHQGTDPAVMSAVGPNADNLAVQIEQLAASAEWRQLLADGRQVVLWVSYGAEWLQRRADQGAQDAALSIVLDQLDRLWLNSTLIPWDGAGRVAVVLVAHADPVAGGVAVPARLAPGCATLNHPTLASRTAHEQIYGSLRTALAALARRRHWAFVDTDVPLGRYAWPSVSARDAGGAFTDCAHYGDRGQALLASVLWACINNETYVAGA